MAAIFFMTTGSIKPIVLESGQTVNTNWYVNHHLPEIFKAVSERRPKIGVRSLILHDDNTRPHRAWITNEFLFENHANSYPKPPNSPDLSPCDFFLFPKLRTQLRGVQFHDDNEMLAALDQAVGSLTRNDFQDCFADWLDQMKKCIDAQGQ